MIINSFIRNNKKYVYIFEHGKIKYGCIENNQIKYNLTDQEIDFMIFKISMLKCELKTELAKGLNFLFLLLLTSNIVCNHFPYSHKLMTYAIEKNDHLNGDEKEFLLSKLYILEENKTYLNTLEIYDNLRNLDIEYATTSYQFKENDYDSYYIPADNKIVINQANCFKNVINDSELSTTLFYETFHCFLNDSYNSNLNKAIVEVMANEYAGELKLNKCAYQDEIIIFYTLSEIIGIEPFKNLIFEGDINLVKNELNSIIPNRDLTNQLIKNIENLSDLKRENNVEEYQITKRKIYEIIKQYFERKYGYEMEQDDTMMVYFSYRKFISRGMDGYKDIYDIYPNGSFSKDYIQEYPNVIYITTDIEQTITYSEAFRKKLILYEDDISTVSKEGDIRLIFYDEYNKIYIVRMYQNVIEKEQKQKMFELYKIFSE